MPPKSRKPAASAGDAAEKSSGAKKNTSKTTTTKGRQPKPSSGTGRSNRRAAVVKNADELDEEEAAAVEEQERLADLAEEDVRHERMDEAEDNMLGLSKRSTTKRKRDEDDQDEKPVEKPRAKRHRSDTKKDGTQDDASKKAPAPKKPAAAKKSATAKKPAAAKKPEAPKKPEVPKVAPAPKKGRATKAAPKQPSVKPAPRNRGPGARGVVINKVPSEVFDVFVFGEGSSGELGLGSKKYDGKKPIDVKRPRINHNLKGVVDIACGGMHCIALTSEQTVLTWGVNDDKALGRDTVWDGGTRDIDEENDSESEDEDDTGINPNESTPGKVDLGVLPEGTSISQVAATDSASFLLTDDGLVYGWGTFRGSDGIIGFSEDVRTQSTPTIIPGLKSITQLACGSNHVLALDTSGKVFAWGSGGQFQLGRKPLARAGTSSGLSPQACGKFTKKHHAVRVGAGSYHSFYIDNNGHVWAWGLNNYAQTGIKENTGEDDAMVLQPQTIQSLEDYEVSQVVGGEHHSVACTTDGKLLTWGRVDGHQVGQPSTLYTEDNAIFDDSGKPRILSNPTVIDDITAKFIAAGTDTSFALDDAGKVYSWGFSANYQTGQGTTDDIEVPTVIDNTAIRSKRIIWAGAGGQFSMIAAAAAADDELPNGH